MPRLPTLGITSALVTLGKYQPYQNVALNDKQRLVAYRKLDKDYTDYDLQHIV